MNCANCGSENRAKVKFCEECGATLTSAVSSASGTLHLTTWRPWRWLFETNFGTLSITDGHLTYKIQPKFSNPTFTFIAKLFSWGLNPLSLFWLNGNAALKNVNATASWKLNWIVWDIHFVFVYSSGFVALYPISADQAPAAIEFVEAVKMASKKAKSNLGDAK